MIRYKEYKKLNESTATPPDPDELGTHIDTALDNYKAQQMALATGGGLDAQLDNWFDEIKYKGQMKVVTADLERDIDALFDDLKKQVRDLTNPRKNWLNNLQGWLRNKNMLFSNESKTGSRTSLVEYADTSKFFKDFSKALNENKRAYLDEIIDSFKDRFKQVVVAHYADKVKRVNDVLTWMDARKDALKSDMKTALKRHYSSFIDDPVDAHRAALKSKLAGYAKPVAPATTTTTPMPTTLTPAPAPIPTTSTVTTGSTAGSTGLGDSASTTSIDTSLPTPSSASGTTVATTGDRGTHTDKLDASSTATIPPTKPSLSSEDEKLIKLGTLVMYGKHLFGKKIEELTQEDLGQVEEMLKDNLPSIDDDEKDQYIAAAKAWTQSVSDRSVTNPTPVVSPMDSTDSSGASGTGSGTSATSKPVPPPTSPLPTASAATDVEGLLAIEDEEEFKTKITEFSGMLRQMKGNEFKDFVIKNDPEIAEMHDGEKWWLKSMRDDVIQEMLWKILQTRKQRESLDYRISVYKGLLQKDQRPQFLIRETVGMSIGERVRFYKKKLNCHEK
jgi:hypothetical protein